MKHMDLHITLRGQARFSRQGVQISGATIDFFLILLYNQAL